MEDGITRNTEFRTYYCDAAVSNKGRSVIGCSSTTTERVSISEMAQLVHKLVALENFSFYSCMRAALDIRRSC